MITCRDLAALLVDYLSDELPIEVRIRLEQHLECCPPCLHYFESYQITIRLTRQLPVDPLPDQLAARLLKALEKFHEGDETVV